MLSYIAQSSGLHALEVHKFCQHTSASDSSRANSYNLPEGSWRQDGASISVTASASIFSVLRF